MITILINNIKYLLDNIYDIYKYDYKNISLLMLVDYEFTELPTDLENLKILCIKNCETPFVLPKEYYNLQVLFLENINYKYLETLPKYSKLNTLIIKCCIGFKIPNYHTLEYLMIDEYITNYKESDIFIKNFPKLRFCRISNLHNFSKIYIDCPNIKIFLNEGNNNQQILMNNYNKKYYNNVSPTNIQDILYEVYNEKINMCNDFKIKFDEFIKCNLNNGFFSKDYFKELLTSFFKFYPKLLYYDYIINYQTIIYSIITDDKLFNKRFNDIIYIDNKQYYLTAYFIKHYTEQIYNFIHRKNREFKNKLFDFIYEDKADYTITLINHNSNITNTLNNTNTLNTINSTNSNNYSLNTQNNQQNIQQNNQFSQNNMNNLNLTHTPQQKKLKQQYNNQELQYIKPIQLQNYNKPQQNSQENILQNFNNTQKRKYHLKKSSLKKYKSKK